MHCDDHEIKNIVIFPYFRRSFVSISFPAFIQSQGPFPHSRLSHNERAIVHKDVAKDTKVSTFGIHFAVYFSFFVVLHFFLTSGVEKGTFLTH